MTNGDIISSWQESSLSKRRFSGQLDFLLGYRYFLKENKDRSLFVENVFHGEFTSINKYPRIKFSVEPAIGMKIRVSDSVNLLSIMSFKQPLGSSSFIEVYKNSFGLRFGVNKTM